MTATTHSIVLRSRPTGVASTDNFAREERPLPALDEGQIMVKPTYLSVDPYMRGRMTTAKSYIAPFEIGKPIESGAIGEVIESRHPDFKQGERVTGMLPWQARSVVKTAGLRKALADVPEVAQLGVLGMPGMTAYVGLFDVAKAKPGDTLFVSAAAGAVGGVVGQLAKIHGCRVVGSAGSDAKVARLTAELGFDAAFNYKAAGDLRRALAEVCPNGIDVYFDNVGGATLEAVLANINVGARIAVCGMVSGYNESEPPPGPRNLIELVKKRARMEGFLVSDFAHRTKDFAADVARYLREGKIKHFETIVEGLDNAPSAFVGMLKGDNFGKMLVRV